MVNTYKNTASLDRQLLRCKKKQATPEEIEYQQYKTENQEPFGLKLTTEQ